MSCFGFAWNFGFGIRVCLDDVSLVLLSLIFFVDLGLSEWSLGLLNLIIATMESQEDFKYEESDRQTTVIQNISTLDLTLGSQAEEESHNFAFPHSSEPVIEKLTINQNDIRDDIEVKIPEFPQNHSDIFRNELNDRNMKIITVEIDFLKQSVCYLQSQLSTKSLEIQMKDDNIEKLEKIIEKQKKKLKDLKSRLKFQDSKLVKLETKLPAYQDLVDKYKTQQTSQIELDKKCNKLEVLVSRMDLKKTKITSLSPRLKNQASPYRVY